MKKLTAILILLFLSFNVLAQLEVKPGSFKEVAGFVNINMDIQTDDNDVPFAVLKVKTENINDKQRRELLFQGDAATFIECEYKVGEVWVYITYKATYLKISHPDLSSTEFWFPFDMQPKKGYELTLVNNAAQSDEELQERIKRLEEALQSQQTQQQPEPQPVIVDKPVKPRAPLYTFVTLNFSNNTYNQKALGLTVGTMRRAGVFISLMTNFDLKYMGDEGSMNHYSSDKIQKFIDDNGYSHKTSYMSYSAIFGFIFKVYGPINMKIGGGYSSNSMIVNLSKGSSYNQNYWVSDVSSYGFGGLIGVQARLGNFVVSLDGATTNFKIFEARIGIGYGFGKKQ